MIDKQTRSDLRDTFVRLTNIILTSELILMSHNGDESNTDHVNKAIAARMAVAEEIIKKWTEDERLKWEEEDDDEEDQEYCRSCGRPE